MNHTENINFDYNSNFYQEFWYFLSIKVKICVSYIIKNININSSKNIKVRKFFQMKTVNFYIFS